MPTENPSYDAVGNRTASHLASGTRTLTYDEENRLTQIALPNGVTVNYKYDGLGRRIQRATNAGASERYVYDGADALIDLNADWSVATTYLNDLGVDDHLRQTNNSSGPTYFLTDHLKSTAVLTDSGGNVVETDNYDSFGIGAASGRTRYTYTGRERDPDSGLSYHRARFYDGELGRFVSEDPISFAGGMNWYSYVDNSPVDDPWGLKPLPRSRTRYRPCSQTEMSECKKMCGPKGVQSCLISQDIQNRPLERRQGSLDVGGWSAKLFVQ